MKKDEFYKKNIKILIFLSVVLYTISFTITLIFGNNYTFKLSNLEEVDDISDIDILFSDDTIFNENDITIEDKENNLDNLDASSKNIENRLIKENDDSSIDIENRLIKENDDSSIDIEKFLSEKNDAIEKEKSSIVEISSKKFEDNVLTINIKTLNKGSTLLIVKNSEESFYKTYQIFVHSLGFITIDNYFGDCTGAIAFQISTTICLLYFIYIRVYEYDKDKKQNMYQYKNIYRLGLIIFLGFLEIDQIILLFNYHGISSSIEKILSSSKSFSMILLPILFLISILVSISNIKLMFKEGRSLRNGLGVILGLLLVVLSISPIILSDYLQDAKWIDVHNENGVATYVESFIDEIVFSYTAYLECLLISTIIYGLKSAKHIPSYDKDYIIILGCQIKKDGTLTNLLKSRVDKAIEFRNNQLKATGKDLIFVPSGGKGKDEVISEGEAMQNYLLSSGIYLNHIVVENKSLNTYENFKFSIEKIKERANNCNIAFSTTNYHVLRSGAIANSISNNIDGIGAQTKRYFWINAFIREFVAILFAEVKKHIKIFVVISIIIALMTLITYLSNVLVNTY